MDGARAALRDTATVLGAHQSRAVADRPEERSLRVDIHMMFAAVDLQRKGRHGRIPSDYVRRQRAYIRLVLISNQTNVRRSAKYFVCLRGTKSRNSRCALLHMSAFTTRMMTVLFSGFIQPENEVVCLQKRHRD